MIKSALFFSIFVTTAFFFFVPQIYAYTDSELTAKYHDLSGVQSALDSGELKCTDLPDNIKSASCTDDAHKVVLPEGDTAPPPINPTFIYTLLGLLLLVPFIMVGVKIFLSRGSNSNYRYDNDEKSWKKEISPMHSFLLKVGLAHQVQKPTKIEQTPISSDLSTLDDHIDTDRVSHTLEETPKERHESKLSPMQEILLSLGILKVTKK